MTISNQHTEACFKAWMKCENILSALDNAGNSFSRKLIQVIDECAIICMGTFNALKNGERQINSIALLCVGICEECAEICEAEKNVLLNECAKICRQCSDVMSPIAFAAAAHDRLAESYMN